MRRTPRTRAAQARRARSLRGFLPAVQPLESRQLLALGDGLQAVYFGTPDFSGSAVTRVDPAVDFNWGGGSPDPGIPADNFSARWTGQVQVPAAGDWTFYAAADDGVRLWVDGHPIIDSWIASAGDERSASLNLGGPGLHAIHLEYMELGGGAQVHLAWSGPGTVKQVIPQSNLAPEPSGILPSPGQVWAVATVPGSIELSWSAAPGATGYVVERSGDGASGWTTIDTPATTSYTETGITPGVTRFYRVSATAGSSASPASAVASAAAQLISDPSFERPQVAPGGQSYGMAGSAWVSGGISSWGDAAGVLGAGSWVVGANPPPPGGGQVGYLDGAGSFSQVVSGWAAGTYTLSFKAARSARGVTGDFLVLIDGALVGNFSPLSANYQSFTTVPFAVASGSHTITFQGLSLAQGGHWALIDELALADVTATTPTPGLSAPPMVALYPAGSRNIALGWFPSHGATGYVVERSDNQDTGWTAIAYPTAPSYTDANLPVGSTWYYRVKATSGSATTAPSLAGWSTSSLLGDPSFEMTPLAPWGSTSNPGPGVTPWTFSGQFDGSAGVSSVFTAATQGNGLPPAGTQAAYILNAGSLSQQVPDWPAGTYTIKFKAARGINGNANRPALDVRVLVDGKSLGTFAIQDAAYRDYETVPFAVTAGTHSISLVGLNDSSEIKVALIDLASTHDVTTTLDPVLPTPDGLKVQALGSRSLGLTWAATYGATGYRVERSNDGSTGWTEIAAPTVPSYTDSDLPVGTARYYRVRATNGSLQPPLQSPFSPAASGSASLLGDSGFEMAPLALGTATSSASALAGSAWIFSSPPPSGEAGVSSNFAAPTNWNGLAPQGTQVAYIVDDGSFSQQVSGLAAGSYTVSFQAARGINGNANRPALDIGVLVDGELKGTFTVQDAAYRTYTANSFAVAAGAHTISLIGLNTSGQPSVALIDLVTLLPVAVQNPDIYARPDVYTLRHDSQLTTSATGPGPLGVLDNDTAGQPGTMSAALVQDVQHGTLVLHPDGSFVYNPDANYYGVDSFTYQVFLDDSLSSPVLVRLLVEESAPLATTDRYRVAGGGTLQTSTDGSFPGVLFNDLDPDDDILTASVVDGVQHGSLIFQSDGTFTYTPAPGFSGSDSFTYAASDGILPGPTVRVTIDVNGDERAPIAADDLYTTGMGQVLQLAASGMGGSGVLFNDRSPSGVPLTAVLVSGPSHGALSLSGDGTFTYTPVPGFSGSDSFTYAASDGSLASNSATVSIQVTQKPPRAKDDRYAIGHDRALVVRVGGILSNDFDPEGKPLTAVLVSGPSHGALSLSGDGTFTYTPAPGFSGSDSFTYAASDGSLASSNATVSISVRETAPVAIPDRYHVEPGTTFSVAAKATVSDATAGVLANDTDPEGDALTASLVAGVQHGTLTLNPDGSFAYVPAAGYTGSDGFTYRASDGILSSTVVSVEFVVASLVPIAADDQFEGDPGRTLLVNGIGVLSNDRSLSGVPLTAVLVSGPSHGALSLSGDGTFTYTPVPGFSGSDSFTYAASDGSLASSNATVSITIAPQAVNAVDDSYSVVAGSTLLTTIANGVQSNDSSLSGAPLTSILVDQVLHGTLSLRPSGLFSYVPSPGYVGTDSFRYYDKDGPVSSRVATVTITVSAPDQIGTGFDQNPGSSPTLGMLLGTPANPGSSVPGLVPLASSAYTKNSADANQAFGGEVFGAGFKGIQGASGTSTAEDLKDGFLTADFHGDGSLAVDGSGPYFHRGGGFSSNDVQFESASPYLPSHIYDAGPYFPTWQSLDPLSYNPTPSYIINDWWQHVTPYTQDLDNLRRDMLLFGEDLSGSGNGFTWERSYHLTLNQGYGYNYDYSFSTTIDRTEQSAVSFGSIQGTYSYTVVAAYEFVAQVGYRVKSYYTQENYSASQHNEINWASQFPANWKGQASKSERSVSVAKSTSRDGRGSSFSEEWQQGGYYLSHESGGIDTQQLHTSYVKDSSNEYDQIFSSSPSGFSFSNIGTSWASGSSTTERSFNRGASSSQPFSNDGTESTTDYSTISYQYDNSVQTRRSATSPSVVLSSKNSAIGSVLRGRVVSGQLNYSYDDPGAGGDPDHPSTIDNHGSESFTASSESSGVFSRRGEFSSTRTGSTGTSLITSFYEADERGSSRATSLVRGTLGYSESTSDPGGFNSVRNTGSEKYSQFKDSSVFFSNSIKRSAGSGFSPPTSETLGYSRRGFDRASIEVAGRNDYSSDFADFDYPETSSDSGTENYYRTLASESSSTDKIVTSYRQYNPSPFTLGTDRSETTLHTDSGSITGSHGIQKSSKSEYDYSDESLREAGSSRGRGQSNDRSSSSVTFTNKSTHDSRNLSSTLTITDTSSHYNEGTDHVFSGTAWDGTDSGSDVDLASGQAGDYSDTALRTDSSSNSRHYRDEDRQSSRSVGSITSVSSDFSHTDSGTDLSAYSYEGDRVSREFYPSGGSTSVSGSESVSNDSSSEYNHRFRSSKRLDPNTTFTSTTLSASTSTTETYDSLGGETTDINSEDGLRPDVITSGYSLHEEYDDQGSHDSDSLVDVTYGVGSITGTDTYSGSAHRTTLDWSTFDETDRYPGLDGSLITGVSFSSTLVDTTYDDSYDDQSTVDQKVSAGSVTVATSFDSGSSEGSRTQTTVEHDSQSIVGGNPSRSSTKHSTATEHFSDDYDALVVDSNRTAVLVTGSTSHSDDRTETVLAHEQHSNTVTTPTGSAFHNVSSDEDTTLTADNFRETFSAEMNGYLVGWSNETHSSGQVDTITSLDIGHFWDTVEGDFGVEHLTGTFTDNLTVTRDSTSWSSASFDFDGGLTTGLTSSNDVETVVRTSDETTHGHTTFSGIVVGPSTFSGTGTFDESHHDWTSSTSRDFSDYTYGLTGVVGADHWTLTGKETWFNTRHDVDDLSGSGLVTGRPSTIDSPTSEEGSALVTFDASNSGTAWTNGSDQAGTTINREETWKHGGWDGAASYSETTTETTTDTFSGSGGSTSSSGSPTTTQTGTETEKILAAKIVASIRAESGPPASQPNASPGQSPPLEMMAAGGASGPSLPTLAGMSSPPEMMAAGGGAGSGAYIYEGWLSKLRQTYLGNGEYEIEYIDRAIFFDFPPISLGVRNQLTGLVNRNGVIVPLEVIVEKFSSGGWNTATIQDFFDNYDRLQPADDTVAGFVKSIWNQFLGLRSTLSTLTKDQRDAALDYIGVSLSIAGIFDPTPASDTISSLIAAYNKQYGDAFVGMMGIIPYLGDAAKLTRIGSYVTRMEKALGVIYSAAGSKLSGIQKIINGISTKLCVTLRKYQAKIQDLPPVVKDPLNSLFDTLQKVLGCFAAGTALLVPGGMKFIEDFQEGDYVLSSPEDDPDAIPVPRRVEAVFHNYMPLLELRIGSASIRTTSEHPFWVEGRGWTPANLLVEGDRFRGHDGVYAVLTGLERSFELAPVYNLSIADYHTYFVSSTTWGFSVWSHNTNAYDDSLKKAARTGARASHVKATHELADEIQAVGLPRSKQTIVLFETKEGRTIIAAGGPDLTSAQKKLAEQKGLLIADDLPKFHAEMTGIVTAGKRGLIPTKGVVTNKMCGNGPESCFQQLTELAGRGGYKLKLSADRRSFEFIK